MRVYIRGTNLTDEQLEATCNDFQKSVVPAIVCEEWDTEYCDYLDVEFSFEDVPFAVLPGMRQIVECWAEEKKVDITIRD